MRLLVVRETHPVGRLPAACREAAASTLRHKRWAAVVVLVVLVAHALVSFEGGGLLVVPVEADRRPTAGEEEEQRRREALRNQNYSWYGNQWMPPRGVPLYRREDMLGILGAEDTLWLGDSTMRRAWATMFALMNASSLSLFEDGQDLSVDALDHWRVIDVNKPPTRQKKYVQDLNTCANRRPTKPTTQPTHPPTTATNATNHTTSNSNTPTTTTNSSNTTHRRLGPARWAEGGAPGSREDGGRLRRRLAKWVGPLHSYRDLCRDLPTLPTPAGGERPNEGVASAPRRFDYVNLDCYHELRSLLERHGATIREEYSLVVIGLGIHEFVNPACTRSDGPPRHPTHEDRLNTTLRAVADMLLPPSAPPSRAKVLWRTQGYTSNQDHLRNLGGFEAMEALNQFARDWVEGYNHHHDNDNESLPPGEGLSSLGLVDWGGAIAPRSRPGTHIVGDLLVHYGLPARTLLAQMLTQQVRLAQCSAGPGCP